jgi:hypothetical protein
LQLLGAPPEPPESPEPPEPGMHCQYHWFTFWQLLPLAQQTDESAASCWLL